MINSSHSLSSVHHSEFATLAQTLQSYNSRFLFHIATLTANNEGHLVFYFIQKQKNLIAQNLHISYTQIMNYSNTNCVHSTHLHILDLYMPIFRRLMEAKPFIHWSICSSELFTKYITAFPFSLLLYSVYLEKL